jgi:hypothetical protein
VNVKLIEKLESAHRAEYHFVFTTGAVGFKFGPFSNAHAAILARRLMAEGIQFFATANCGVDLDWDLARQFKAPAKKRKKVTRK